ncbi:MAG: HEAT repeat domain-containing protein [Methanobrevibacter sp.]|uniref:HEAT repeat domain-containing protein n=1 Tax=Methanobrevibacter sp. TaxID=66852 RepID=UPI0025D57C90|nr:HEAT repeat domain-containing protein [Methanobrevibacter sp.]MBR0271050.1 HEAT repeat domain-containing protein [Methanobrevibacter sp.]
MSNLTMTEAIENLQNEDVSIRKEAIESLIGVTDEEAIDPLIEATTDENAQVRFKAAEILGNMGNVAFDRLVSKFTSETGKNKRFLAFALKETNNEKAIPLFAEAVSDEDFGVRKVSIRALGELQAHGELDTIAKGLDDEDWGVKLATIYACADLASDESIDLIKKARRAESEKDFKKSCNKAIKKAEKIQKAKAEGKVVSSTIPMKTIKEMEKTNPQKAIKEYEKYVDSGTDKDAPYKRLAVLYRKLRQDDNEIAVLEKAIEVLSEKKPGKEDWFVKRLEKMR